MSDCVTCGAPRWNRTKFCRAHYYQDYRKRKKGVYDTNGARKRRRNRPTLVDQRPHCRNRGCTDVLDCTTDSNGQLITLPCVRCARFVKGLCHSCDRRLTNKDRRPGRNGTKVRSRWCRYCYPKRFREKRNAINRKYRATHPEQKAKQYEYRRRYYYDYEKSKGGGARSSDGRG